MGLPRKRAVARVGLQRTELVRPDICMATTIFLKTAASHNRQWLVRSVPGIRRAQADLESLWMTPFVGNSRLGVPNLANCPSIAINTAPQLTD